MGIGSMRATRPPPSQGAHLLPEPHAWRRTDSALTTAPANRCDNLARWQQGSAEPLARALGESCARANLAAAPLGFDDRPHPRGPNRRCGMTRAMVAVLSVDALA